jgi:hypothetical protein
MAGTYDSEQRVIDRIKFVAFWEAIEVLAEFIDRKWIA